MEIIMSTPNYVPGQAYSHGYEARMEGKEMPPSSEIGLYWDEYRAGWFDAHRVILENARRDYQEIKNKLDENSDPRSFLQD
jgi:hypothetical protein